MMNFRNFLFLLIQAGLLISSAKANENAVPLFAEEQVINLTIISDFPYRSFHQKQQPDVSAKVPAVITYTWKDKTYTQTATLQARGSGRLSHCQFAPFKIDLDDKAEGVFLGITNNLKVVSHCDEGLLFPNQEASDDVLIKEYLLYKILNVLPHPSFRVRAVKIRYEKMDGSYDTTRMAFFIEPVKNLMRRNSTIVSELKDDWSKEYEEIVKRGEASEQEIVQVITNRVNHYDHVFNNLAQLLLLNDDWGGTIRTANAKSFAKLDNSITRVHYDFDLSLLVGKFEARKDRMSYPYPSSVEGDRLWIQNFCNKQEDMIDLSRKQRECTNVVQDLKAYREKTLSLIRNFNLLDNPKKDEIEARAINFFDSL